MAAAAYSDHIANICAGPSCLTKKAYHGGTMVTEFTQSSGLDCQQKCAALLTCNFWDWDGTSTCRLLSDDKGGAQVVNGLAAARAAAGQKLCAGAPDPQAGALALKHLCFFCETSQVHQHEPRTKRSKKNDPFFLQKLWLQLALQTQTPRLRLSLLVAPAPQLCQRPIGLVVKLTQTSLQLNKVEPV